ncbi:MAG: NHL repeat-containing protein [Planctomycetota bacterium]
MHYLFLYIVCGLATAADLEGWKFPFFQFDLVDLLDPMAVAIAPDGRFYVADSGNHRIQVFDHTGKPLRSIGKLGDGPGELRFPHGIALTTDGHLYVVDSGNSRIQVLDAGGRALSSWGGHGKKAGLFNDPRRIAVAGDRVYVADTGNHRVQVFDLKGKFLFSIGEYGNGPGQFHRPLDVAVDDEGLLYVADSENHRIQKFRGSGEFVKQWGDWGFFPGLFATPSGVACLGEGVYVVDSQNHRVQVFDREGNLKDRWGAHTILPHQGKGHMHYPNHIALTPEFAVVCESFENRCQVFVRHDPEGKEVLPLPGSRAPAAHYGRRGDLAGNLLAIPEPDTYSVPIFDLRGPEPIFIHRLGDHGLKYGQFTRITDVLFVDGGSRLYVSDPGNRRLQLFTLPYDPEQPIRFQPHLSRLVKSIDLVRLAQETRALAALQEIEPAALARDSHGQIYIVDPGNSMVLVFDEKLRFQRRWGGYGSGPGELRRPTELAFSVSGRVTYVVDSHNHRVQAFDRKGKFLFSWGQHGSGPGEFLAPFGIAAGRDGFVYVTDTGSHRVQKFDEKGKYLAQWGTEGMGAGQFYKPQGILQDAQHRLIVIDYGNHRAQIFTPEGIYRGVFGSRSYIQPARFRPK